MTGDTYEWGSGANGLELGLRARPSVVHAGGAVDIELAVRNRSAAPLTVGPSIALLVRSGDTVDEHGSGPRSSEDTRVGAGETIALLSWQLTDEQFGSAPGPRVLSAVYRPAGGGELRSAQVRFEVVP
jgi:hypothetical protein